MAMGVSQEVIEMKLGSFKSCAFIVGILGLAVLCPADDGLRITGWSSSKTGDRDRMFLVKPGEGITFTVNVAGAVSVEWFVNKRYMVSGAIRGRRSTFAWTVPKRKGIWEIHALVRGESDSEHCEWVVSTLSREEAPDFFEYFVDKRHRWREELDPWGRPLPEWVDFPAFGIPDLSKCRLEPTDRSILDDERNTFLELCYPYKHAYGTLRFKYCVPEGPHCTHGGWTHFRFNFLHYPGCGFYRRMFYVREAGQDHAYYGPGAHAWDHDMSVGYERNSYVWYDVTIIHTYDDEFYAFRDGILEMRGHDWRGGRCTGISIRLHTYTPEHTPQSKIYIDCIEIYKDEFLFPKGFVDEPIRSRRPLPTAPRRQKAKAERAMTVKAEPIAKPLITEWWNSKTNDDDRMFTVESGERITFRVVARDCDRFQWQVNKRTVQSGSPEFRWTVPQRKGIWEIHLKVMGKNGEAHHEWVVSNLARDEAPALFDYFADGRFEKREETDPWGRKLPEWRAHKFSEEWPKPFPDMVAFGNEPPKNWFKGALELSPDTSCCYLQPQNVTTTRHIISYLSSASKALFGTWKLRFCFPNGHSRLKGGWCHFNYRFAYCNGYLAFPAWLTISSDNHHHLRPGSYRWGMDYGAYFKPEPRWYELTIIRTRDYEYYTFVDGILQYRRRNPMTIWESGVIWLRLARYNTQLYPNDTVYVDCLEIYPDRYMFPEKSVTFGSYTEHWRWNGRRFFKQTRKGIILKGRSLTLSDVSRLLGDPSLMSYDPRRKEAVCRADLVLESGAELEINGEVLKFDSKPERPLKFVVGYGATLKIIRSTVTTVDEGGYFVWEFCNSTRFGFPLSLRQKEQCLNVLNYSSLADITIVDSTVRNCGQFFVENPNRIQIVNSRFENIREIDDGEYSAPKGIARKRRRYARGPKGFWLASNDIPVEEFEIRDVRFRASPRGTKKLKLLFMLKREQEEWNVYDLDADGCIISVKSALGSLGGQLRRYESYLGLVNCRFDQLQVLDADAVIVPKYYLDVLVVDQNGKPVPGAIVKIINEVDVRYRPENMERYSVETGEMGEGISQTLRWHLPLDETITDKNGHTPLPSDKEHTVIVADYLLGKGGKTEFTYTIRATSAEGLTGIVTNVDPSSSWYRPDPMKPTHTVKVVLGRRSKAK
jgi:hypothetical protein